MVFMHTFSTIVYVEKDGANGILFMHAFSSIVNVREAAHMREVYVYIFHHYVTKSGQIGMLVTRDEICAQITIKGILDIDN